MALLTKKEFADKCGINTSALSVQIGRGKVVVGSDDLIDTTNYINQAFQVRSQKRKAVKEALSPVTEPVVQVVSEEVAPVPASTPEKKKVRTTIPSVDQATLFEMQKEELEIEKLKEGNRLMKLKADKAAGMLIPTDLVKTLFLQHSKSITDNFRNALEDVFTLICAKYGIPATDLADMRKKGLDAINKAVADAIENTKKDVKNIVAEYSQARGVGEKQ